MSDVIVAINGLSNSMSQGPDLISSKFLKQIVFSISLPLTLLFQKSLNSGCLPALWKSAYVIPLYKGKGSKFDILNYRPISLTSSICKVMEKIVRKKLVEHCSVNNIISVHQHGFMSNHSTVTNLLEITNDLSYNADNGFCTHVVCIDFAKAFDSVCHNKLVHKLHAYGIRGNVLKWIKNFLLNRSFRVKLNDCLSSDMPVASSVPQGSICGPILFNLYINDLQSVLKNCKFKLYADDLTVYMVVNNIFDVKLLQDDLNAIVTWADKWQIKINFEKCRCMCFGNNCIIPDYVLGDHHVVISQCEKILGVYVDSNLYFTHHIFEIVKKARTTVNLILHAFKNCDCNLLINLYKTYARPYLEYASVVISPHHLYLIDLIENVQRNFTKRLPLMYNTNYPKRLQLCNLQSLELRRLHNDLIFLYKYLHKNVSVLFEDSIKRVLNSSTRGNAFKLLKLRCRLDVRKYYFTHRVVNIWNSLPDRVVSAYNVRTFVNELHNVDLSKFIRGRAF
jgi:hypothetical protein